QDDSVEIHPVVLLEVPGKARGARRSVAFAREEFCGRPTFVACGPETYKFSDGLNVLLHSMKLVWRLAGNRAAVASGNGINKHDVRHIEQGIFVVHEAVGRRQ